MHDLNKALGVLGLLTLTLNGNAGADELTGHIGAYSNYIWRGISLTDDAAAIQGGLDYVTNTGAYLGAWASNLNVDASNGRGYQIDFYAGMAGKMNELTYDIGLLRMTYPLIDSSDNLEIYGTLGYAGASIGVWTELQSAAPDDDALGSNYVDANFSFNVPNMNAVAVNLHGGYWFAKEAEEGFDNYFDYGVKVSKSTQMGDFSIGMYGTTLDRGEGYPVAIDATMQTFSKRPRAVVGWRKRFDF